MTGIRPLDLRAAAKIVIETVTEMASEGRPLMTRVLPEGRPLWWAHYPDNDARDARTRSRWYYHVHPPGDRDSTEHGHFHLFLHRTQIEGAEVLVAPAAGEDAAAHVAHVAGLSIDPNGIPMSWFTTNRWVTDEFLHSANTIIAHLDRYDVDETAEDKTVNRFVTAMVALYRDEIAALLRERDIRLAALAAGQPLHTVTETGNAVLSQCAIDLDAKISAL